MKFNIMNEQINKEIFSNCWYLLRGSYGIKESNLVWVNMYILFMFYTSDIPFIKLETGDYDIYSTLSYN